MIKESCSFYPSSCFLKVWWDYFLHTVQSNANIFSIRLLDGKLTGTTTLGQSGPGGNGNEDVLLTSQSFITGTLPSDVV